MKKKPDENQRRHHSGNTDADSNEFDMSRKDDSAYDKRRNSDHSSEAANYEQSGAVGVESSFGNFYDLFRNSGQEGENEEGFSFDYQPCDMDDDYSSLPSPAVFNAYPPEVQRKILEWTDRDVKARRDDESRRQDTVLREKIARERLRVSIPVGIVVLGIICAAITSIWTKNPVFAVAFLIIPLAIIIALIARAFSSGKGSS